MTTASNVPSRSRASRTASGSTGSVPSVSSASIVACMSPTTRRAAPRLQRSRRGACSHAARYADPVQSERGTLERPDGTRLATVSWRPDGGAPPAGQVVLVHGFGEYTGRYGHVAAHLTGHGYAVHALDLRGHGLSTGRRGHIGRWQEYRDDLAAFVDHAREGDGAALHTFVYGHSLGGAIVLEYGLRLQPPIAGVIASAPALVPSGVRHPILEGLGRVISPVWPTFGVHLPLEHAALSRQPETADRYDRDPLVHGTHHRARRDRVPGRTALDARARRCVAAAPAAPARGGGPHHLAPGQPGLRGRGAGRRGARRDAHRVRRRVPRAAQRRPGRAGDDRRGGLAG